MIRSLGNWMLIALGSCAMFFAATLFVAGIAVACLLAAAHAMPIERSPAPAEPRLARTVPIPSENALPVELFNQEREGGPYHVAPTTSEFDNSGPTITENR